MPRRQARNGRKNTVSSKVRHLQNVLNGGKRKVNPDPSPVVRVPWNSVTLSFVGASPGESDFNIGSIRTALISQLMFPNDLHFEIRLLSVRVWGPPSPNKTIALTVAVADLTDLSDGALEPIAVLQDFGTTSNRACVHYTWPVSQTKQVIATEKSGATNVLEVNGAEIIYFTVLWKPRATGSRVYTGLNF